LKIDRGEGVLRGKAQQCAIQDNPRLCASCVYSNANIEKEEKSSHHRLQPLERMNEKKNSKILLMFQSTKSVC
jgi:hypothetical protein